jgi:hypothetical protein
MSTISDDADEYEKVVAEELGEDIDTEGDEPEPSDDSSTPSLDAPPAGEHPFLLQQRRAFDRARRALLLAARDGLPLPSVRLYADSSAEFIFPGKLARALKGQAQELTQLIGNNKLSVATTVAEDPDAVSICVSADVLGREED